uniref:Monoglyceride lipase n=1 Tax=Petromyzon marinus TaxID=7757 RepID=S4RN00_PETMA
RGLVCVMHGAGEHCGRYDELAKTLTRHSLLVFGHDHVGHGRSTRVRLADIHVDMHVRDCLQHVRRVRGTHPRLPCFLLGHSLGHVDSKCAEGERGEPEDPETIHLFSPLSRRSISSAKSGLRAHGEVLQLHLPPFTLGSLDPSLLWPHSREGSEVRDYASDPLVYHGRVRVAFAVRLLHTVSLLARLMPSVSWPFLLLHGSRDQLCDPAGSQMLVRPGRQHGQDHQGEMYEGAYHVLHRELPDVKEAVLREIQQWIMARL